MFESADDEPFRLADGFTVEDILRARQPTCDYEFNGKSVRALCSHEPDHRGGHGRWRDPETHEPI